MPPYVTRYAADDVLRYFEAIARAAEVPVFVQNAGVAAMNPATLLKLVREVPGMHYVKEEVAPAHHNIARLAEAREPGLWGVFGGGGAQNLPGRAAPGGRREHARQPVHGRRLARLLLWEAGHESEARELHMRLQPALQRERLAGVASAKAVLVRRGIIRNERTRGAGTPLDSYDRAELDAIWPQIEALFSWKR